MLGEFEYLLLTAAVRWAKRVRRCDPGGDRRRHRTPLLHRRALYHPGSLGEKGLLKTWMGEATPQRGGRAKRMVRVTSKGVRAAQIFTAP